MPNAPAAGSPVLGKRVSASDAIFPEVDARFSRFAGLRNADTGLSTLAYGHAGRPKVLYYDLTKLVTKGAFLTSFTAKGTIFNMDHTVGAILLMYAFVAALAFCAAHFFSNIANFENSRLESTSAYLNSFIPFILGLYVAISLKRWWDLRTDGIGKVLDSAQNITLISAAMFPGAEFGPYKDQLLKYSLASISLIMNMARSSSQDKSIVELGPKRDNLLSAQEVEILQGIPHRSHGVVVWTWILLLATRVMEAQAVAPSRQRDITSEVIKARDAIERIIMHMQTQLPFAYVHLVTLLVNMNNLVMSLKCGVVMAGQLEQKNYVYAACQLIYLFAVPLLYQGLLSVSYVIHDPFGEDLLDFPVMAYQEYANEACVAMTHYTKMCPALSKKWGEPASDYKMQLRKGAGKTVAAASARPSTAAAAAAARAQMDELHAQQLSRQKEEENVVLSQMRAQNELIEGLRRQNAAASSTVKDLNAKVASLEERLVQMPVSGALFPR